MLSTGWMVPPTIWELCMMELVNVLWPDALHDASCQPYILLHQREALKRITVSICVLKVQLRLVDYLSTNNLLNSFQSVYIKHHSNDTTRLSVHNQSYMSHQKVTCLTLLDLSAAFEIIEHSIRLEGLSSWFGISSTALVSLASNLIY